VSDQAPLRLHQLLEMLPPEDLATMGRLLEEDIRRDVGFL
jgi:hypothetical protein